MESGVGRGLGRHGIALRAAQPGQLAGQAVGLSSQVGIALLELGLLVLKLGDLPLVLVALALGLGRGGLTVTLRVGGRVCGALRRTRGVVAGTSRSTAAAITLTAYCTAVTCDARSTSAPSESACRRPQNV